MPQCHPCACYISIRLFQLSSVWYYHFRPQTSSVYSERAAKLVFQAKKYDHASPCLKQLHWLPVHSRIAFKILVIVYKCFTNNAPSYLRDLTIPYKCNKPGLRSSNDDRLLTIPKNRSLSGDKGFHHAGPDLWNNLPRHWLSLRRIWRHIYFQIEFDCINLIALTCLIVF